ncbi:MAG TPA: hypothetical protein VH253_19030 [Phycisphaerae bacterium]|nr:hypothetical protein [Phycisphaerae bacterium]
MLPALLITLLTLPLLLLARRGRRTDTHPLCRKCRFDLFNKPPTSTRCPECGADVTHPNALRIGHRQRNPFLLAATTALFTLSLLTTLLLTTLRLTHFNYYPYLPLSLLAHQAISGSPTDKARAFAELTRRVSTGPPASAAPIIDVALHHQADRTEPWDERWANLIVEAQHAGTIGPGQLTTCLRQAFNFHPSIRQRAAVDDPLILELHPDLPRVPVGFAPMPDFMAVDSIEFHVSARTLNATFPQPIPGGENPLRDWPRKLGPGPADVAIHIDYRVEGTLIPSPVTYSDDQQFHITILRPGQSSVTLLHRPDLEPAMIQTLTAEYYYLPDTGESVLITFDHPPLNAAFNVSINGTNVGTLTAYADRTNRDSFPLPGYGPDWHGSDTSLPPLDLTFTPAPAAAANTTDLYDIYGDPLHIKIERYPVGTPLPPQWKSLSP